MSQNWLERKATVEIQRRPARTGTIGGQRNITAGLDNFSGGATSGESASTASSSLNEIYAPDGFYDQSTILACNFPAGVSTNQCRIFFSWIGAVIRVDRTVSPSKQQNFIVVFATEEHAKLACSLNLSYDDNTIIDTRMITEKNTLWKKISNLITF